MLVAKAPMADASMTDASMTNVPMTDVPMTDVPMTDVPMTDAPMTESIGTEGSPAARNLTERTVATARDVLAGRRGGARAWLAFAGPAVIASIAYMDPGNYATNIQAGAKYGYDLLWVVVAANLIAMLFQALSAKLGIVTGRNLAEMCRDRFPRPVVWAMWAVSEVAAMATDLAEFLGGAIGLSLLFHLPLIVGMAITACITYAILMVERSGFRPVELIIAGLIGVIGLCYLIEMFIAPVDWGAAAVHMVVPNIPDAEALLLSVGIIGATVMPHAIYLHSGLTQARTPVRNDEERSRVLRFSNREVVVALAIAGMVNMAMVMMASSAFHAGHSDVAEIETAYHTLTPLLGVGGGRLVPGLAHRIGDIELGGRHHGRPDDHAGLRPISHPDLAAAAGDDGARLRRRRARRRFHQGAGHQPGRAQHRAAAAHDRAPDVHRARRHHGPVRQFGRSPMSPRSPAPRSCWRSIFS